MLRSRGGALVHGCVCRFCCFECMKVFVCATLCFDRKDEDDADDYVLTDGP